MSLVDSSRAHRKLTIKPVIQLATDPHRRPQTFSYADSDRGKRACPPEVLGAGAVSAQYISKMGARSYLSWSFIRKC